ncbi:unnamed protein product, partial [Prorocentrum cordatum]
AMRWTAALLATWAVKVVRGGPVSESEDDVQSSGACKAAIASYCPRVPPGGGALTHCLIGAIKRDSAVKGLSESRGVTSACKTEINGAMAREVRRKSPSAPAPGRLGDTKLGPPRTGLPGLRGHGGPSVPRAPAPKLAPPGARAPSLPGGRPAPMLAAACGHEMASLCAGLGGSAALPCLRAHEAELSLGCSQKLFLVQPLRAGDAALAPRVFAACQADLHDVAVCGRAPPAIRRASGRSSGTRSPRSAGWPWPSRRRWARRQWMPEEEEEEEQGVPRRRRAQPRTVLRHLRCRAWTSRPCAGAGRG